MVVFFGSFSAKKVLTYLNVRPIVFSEKIVKLSKNGMFSIFSFLPFRLRLNSVNQSIHIILTLYNEGIKLHKIFVLCVMIARLLLRIFKQKSIKALNWLCARISDLM